MWKRKSILLLFVLPFCSWAHEPREGKIYASLGPYIYRNHHLKTPRNADTIRNGFSLIVEGDVDYNGGIEISISYLEKNYSRVVNGLTNVEATKRIYINTGYRHWFSKDFSIGLSFFSAYSMGNVEVIKTDFPLSQRPDSSAADMAEYGFDLSLVTEFLRSQRFAGFLDTRYSYSVTNKEGEDGNHYGFIVGIKYMIQDPARGIEPP